MDDAINIKISYIAIILYLLMSLVCAYSLYASLASLYVKLFFSFFILSCLFISLYKNRKAQLIRGIIRLTPQGLFPTNSDIDNKFSCKLQQSLPWCVAIQLGDKGNTFDKLIWRDSLSKQDWRKLRAYLSN